jgi:nucleotide-binding universal stress UspA family protein
VVQRGEAGQVILDTARDRGVDLIVMSTHGWGGLERWLYGSVADQVLRRAHVPVLLVPAACAVPWPAGGAPRVVVPLDGSAFAEEAVAPATDLARALGADLLLVRVVDSRRDGPGSRGRDAGPPAATAAAAVAEAREYLERMARSLRAAGQTAEVRVMVGASPPAAIVAAAREAGGAMIAMTTHGRGGLARLALGSVATETLQLADVPLLLVRPEAMRSAQAPASTGSPIGVALAPDELDLLERALRALQQAGGSAGDADGAQRILARIERARHR